MKIVLLMLVGAFLGLAITGCPKPVPSPVTPPDASDAAPAPLPVTPASCGEVCATVARLGCKGAKSCSANCPRVQSQTYKDCVRSASSCDRVNLCDQGVGNE